MIQKWFTDKEIIYIANNMIQWIFESSSKDKLAFRCVLPSA